MNIYKLLTSQNTEVENKLQRAFAIHDQIMAPYNARHAAKMAARKVMLKQWNKDWDKANPLEDFK